MSARQTIVITGGTGLVGSRFVELYGDYSDIYILTRSVRADTDQIKYVQWDVDKQWVDKDRLPDRTDVLINLVGAGIADKRWTDERKRVLINSRVKATELLHKTYQYQRIGIYIGASAIGYYGNRKDEILTESSLPDHTGFLTECCALWEKSSDLLKPIVENHYILRIGIVLSSNGGALPKLVIPARLGGAGYFGNGQMYYSWIHIDDLCGSIRHLIKERPPSNIFNGVSPHPLQLKELMRSVKNIYAKYAILLSIPIFGVKLAMGEMVSMLTNSTRVIPHNLLEVGYDFAYSDIHEALHHIKSQYV